MTDYPLSPACIKCEQVTGNTTCFPAPCVFFLERSTPGTKSHNVATLDRIRRGGGPIYASVGTHPEGGDAEAAPFMSDAVGEAETPEQFKSVHPAPAEPTTVTQNTVVGSPQSERI